MDQKGSTTARREPGSSEAVAEGGTGAQSRPVVHRLEPADLENCDLDELFDAVAAWQEGALLERPTPAEAPREPEPVEAPGASGDIEFPWTQGTSHYQARQAELIRLEGRLRTTLEDFERFRRRVEERRADEARRANEQVLRALLPIFDDLHRAAEPNGARDVQQVQDGVRLIAARLDHILSGFGVQPFESAGRPFDPAVHEAIRLQPTTELPPNHVVLEIERGYWYQGKLLRPARVCVSSSTQAPSKADGSGPAPNQNQHQNQNDASS